MSDTCACCRRPWPEIPDNGGFSENRRDVSACTECIPHAGYAQRANSDHIEAWRVVVAVHDLAHAREVQQLSERIEALIEELAARPEKVVLTYIDQQEMREAKDEADRAFRSRDHAYQALCEIRLLHRERSDGSCRCGKRASGCDEARIVSEYRGLINWEKNQVDRKRSGLAHSLPDSHPAVLDSRWNEWDD